MARSTSPMGLSEAMVRQVYWRRARHGWSQYDLAARLTELGWPTRRNTLHKLEGGHRQRMSVDELCILAAALLTSPQAMLDAALADMVKRGEAVPGAANQAAP